MPRKVKKQYRVELSGGVMSPLMSLPLYRVAQEFNLGAHLSYDAFIALNGCVSTERAQVKKLNSGGAYSFGEHHQWNYIQANGIKSKVHKALLPWLEMNAKEIRSYGAFSRALQYAILMNMASYAVTSKDIETLTKTTSVYITMSQMVKAEIIGLSGKNEQRLRTFVLTPKGKTFIRLANESMDREENSLRALLKI
jgi:hypothetical protein